MYDGYLFTHLYAWSFENWVCKKNAFFYSSGNLKQQKLNLNVSNIQIKAD